jgi:hypothetical protein
MPLEGLEMSLVFSLIANGGAPGIVSLQFKQVSAESAVCLMLPAIGSNLTRVTPHNLAFLKHFHFIAFSRINYFSVFDENKLLHHSPPPPPHWMQMHEVAMDGCGVDDTIATIVADQLQSR